MIKQFYYKQFILHESFVCTQCINRTVEFDLFIGPYQGVPIRVREELGAMAIKRYTTFPKALALLEPQHHIGQCPIQDRADVFYSTSRLGRTLINHMLLASVLNALFICDILMHEDVS